MAREISTCGFKLKCNGIGDAICGHITLRKSHLCIQLIGRKTEMAYSIIRTASKLIYFMLISLTVKRLGANDVIGHKEDVYDFLQSKIEQMIDTSGPCAWLGPPNQVLHYTISCVQCWCEAPLRRYQCHEAQQCEPGLWPVKQPLVTGDAEHWH